jgi:hypothetical protein
MKPPGVANVTLLLIIKIVGLIVGAVATIDRARDVSKTARDKQRLILFATLGFGVALVAELVDASQNRKRAFEAIDRNNALLAEVQRTLHPLFPLNVNVDFRASLSEDATRVFGTQLEKKYQREPDANPRIAWLYPEEPDFPTCKKDPVAFQIVSAYLSSVFRLYSRQRSKRGEFQKADIEFSVIPEFHNVPSGKGVIIGSDEARRRRVRDREYIFSPGHGLYIHHPFQKIDFVDTKNTTEMMSADDLMGATLEIAIQPIDPSENDCKPVIPAQTGWISLANVGITLPGWRRLVIDHQRFTLVAPSKDSEDWIRYRFVIPESKSEFEKLIREEPIWVTAERQ